MIASLLAATESTFAGPHIDWYRLSPLLILLGGGLVLLVGAALTGDRWPRGSFAFVSVTTSSAAAVLSIFLWHDVSDNGRAALVARAVSLDHFSLFLTFTLCITAALSSLMLDQYLRREGQEGPEVHALVLLSTLGGVIMSMANDMIVLFLGLEVLSIALYVMAAAHRRRIESQEAAIKYFVLGAFSSAFFLYGIALVYGATGSTNLTDIRDFLDSTVLPVKQGSGLLLAGFALLLVGLGFKVAAAPFHTWSPDVYQGSPSPVAGFMAAAAKAAGFAGLLRVFVLTFATRVDDWRPVLYVLAIATLVVGSVMALVQTNVKRMLAYSSISHAGYVLVGVEAANRDGTAGALFYLLTYAVMVVGTFGVVTVATKAGDDDHELSAFTGLFKRRPVLALTFALFLLAQAGVPFTSGFWAKAGVIQAAVQTRDGYGYSVAIVAMLCAAIAAFLYLRIVKTMFFDDSDGEVTKAPATPVSAALALALAAAFTLAVGFAPGYAVDWARQAVPALAR